MGMDLRSESGQEFHFNICGWRNVLKMALDTGWEPAGTSIGPETEWCGTYFTNEGQLVTADDAKSIAVALTKAVSFVPDIEQEQRHKNIISLGPGESMDDAVNEIVSQMSQMSQMSHMNDDEDPYARFSGLAGKQRLKDFIRFCESGGFVIC